MNNQEKKLITLEEASQATPYTADYLGQLIRKGRLEAWKEKGRWRTTKIAVEEYMLKVAEESFEHHETLAEKIPELNRNFQSKWKWAYVGLGAIFIAAGIFGSYAFFGAKEAGVCKSFEVARDENGNQIIRVGGQEYARNIFATTGKEFPKMQF
jgi:hypothetical protein